MKSFLIAEILGLDEEMPTIPKLIPKLEVKNDNQNTGRAYFYLNIFPHF
jgi:hypothetical protein